MSTTLRPPSHENPLARVWGLGPTDTEGNVARCSDCSRSSGGWAGEPLTCDLRPEGAAHGDHGACALFTPWAGERADGRTALDLYPGWTPRRPFA
jgi:hypothetical protein